MLKIVLNKICINIIIHNILFNTSLSFQNLNFKFWVTYKHLSEFYHDSMGYLKNTQLISNTDTYQVIYVIVQ